MKTQKLHHIIQMDGIQVSLHSLLGDAILIMGKQQSYLDGRMTIPY